MTERVLLVVWGIWLVMIFVAACRVYGFLFAKSFQKRRWRRNRNEQRPVVLIVPVKGFDLKSTPRFFDSLFSQDYPNYRVIVCFESWKDPVAVWLKDQFDVLENDPVWHHPDGETSLRSVTLACAGTSQDEGQKVHNQRAAFEYLEPEDSIIAFADADIWCKSDWLATLVAPINERTHPLSTTYRWLVPKRPTLPNQIASVINGSITTQGGSEATNVLWGGSMAISRDAFDELDVPALFRGSLNDDLRLSKAARRSGRRIAFVRSLVMPTMIDFSWGSFLEFAKRQYTQVKFFSPILYTGTNFVLGFYVAGLASIIAAVVYGYFYAWIPLAAAYIIDQFRALGRVLVYVSLFPENGIRSKLFAASWLEHMLTPVWMLLHWLILVSTWTQSRIRWAGISYRIVSKSETRVLDRPVMAERLPAGVPGLALIAELHDRQLRGFTPPVATPEHGVETVEGVPYQKAVLAETTEPAPEMAASEISPAPEEPTEALLSETREELAARSEATAGSTAREDEQPETDFYLIDSWRAPESERSYHFVEIVPARLVTGAGRRHANKSAQPRKPKRPPGKSLLSERLRKTRIPFRKTFPVSPVTKAEPPQVPIIEIAPAGPASEPMAASTTFPLARSFAARRTRGAIPRLGAKSRPTPRSSRANQSGQPHSNGSRPVPVARPTSRGASARP